MPRRKAQPEEGAALPGDATPPALPEGMDSEEEKIFRQSIPKEAITRDFLQELLDEHRGSAPPRKR